MNILVGIIKICESTAGGCDIVFKKGEENMRVKMLIYHGKWANINKQSPLCVFFFFFNSCCVWLAKRVQSSTSHTTPLTSRQARGGRAFFNIPPSIIQLLSRLHESILCISPVRIEELAVLVREPVNSRDLRVACLMPAAGNKPCTTTKIQTVLKLMTYFKTSRI